MTQAIIYIIIGIIVAGIVFELYPVECEEVDTYDLFIGTIVKAVVYSSIWIIVIPIYLVRLAIRKVRNERINKVD